MSKKITILLIFLLLVGIGFGISKGSAQEKEKMPATTVSQAFFTAQKKFDKVDRNKNKILDGLEKRLKPAVIKDRFDVIVLLNKQLEVLPTLKNRHGGFVEKFRYHSINGFAANLTKGQILALADDMDIKSVEYDAPVYPHLSTAQQWFGVTKAKTDFGIDGNLDGSATYSKDDIVVAVIDTGIDPNHVDLDNGKIIGWKDFATGKPDPYDQVQGCGGHGTHVSSIVAGEGEGNSLYKGVAPGAALVGVKVLKKQGNDCTGSMSDVDAGIQWVIDNKDTYGINVINMSIGAAGSSDGADSTSQLVNQAVAAGIVTVVSAGNEGPEKYTIGSPSAAAEAITVGAMADVEPGSPGSFSCGSAPGYGFYQICFSSRGPTADERIKPDISAPGVFIKAAKAGTANQYTEMSGTSMSSPFVAGLAGLMLQADSTLTPGQVKDIIMNTAWEWGPTGNDVDYGSGRLQAYEAIKSAGSFSDAGPTAPSHSFTSDSLAGTGDQDFWDINVTDASLPLAVTMVMSNWASSNNPDFDIELRNPSGTVIANSITTTRQETIGVQPTITGIYQLKVYSYVGLGPYFFDVSFGEAAVSITMTSDGVVEYGIMELDTTQDTTASDLNDAQTVQVDTGPANLDIKTTIFTDNGNSWSLGSSNGSDQVKWEYSSNGSSWNTFFAADTPYYLANGLSTNDTQDFYFRLTMPTGSSSVNQYSAGVTIVATAP